MGEPGEGHPGGGPPVLVLMGVSGSGKSTVGRLLSAELGWDFAEGDRMHPPANVRKMAAGHPLDDEDRWPWLARVAGWVHAHTAQGRPGIVACSALKRRYRDVLRGDRVVFVYLAGTKEQIARRVAARHGHFMPPALLNSQFADLEPPGGDEEAITVGLLGPPAQQAREIMSRLALAHGPSSAAPHLQASDSGGNPSLSDPMTQSAPPSRSCWTS